MDYTEILEYLNKVPNYHGASEHNNLLGMKRRQLVLNEDEDVETFLKKFQSSIPKSSDSKSSGSKSEDLELEESENLVEEYDDDYSPDSDSELRSEPEELEVIGDAESVGPEQNWDYVNDLINSYKNSRQVN